MGSRTAPFFRYAAVPAKARNKGGKLPADGLEGRERTKENTAESNSCRTQSRASGSSRLDGVRQAAQRDRQMRFTALLHHVSVDLLRDSYYRLKRQAAPGVDEITWQEYGKDLEDRLTDLHGRVHRGAYRAQPSRRVYIPKSDGRQRPLGIAGLEDKIVQQAVRKVLEQIYEEDFLGFSYGFRPGRSQHDALDALTAGIVRKKVNWILDADIRGFFDHLNHERLVKFLELRIGDRRIIRLIRKWLKAGVLEEGRWQETQEGTPQGAVISPLLSNLYLHHVLDQWVQAWRKEKARGDVMIVRYADDFVMGFQHRAEAERFRQELAERLGEFRTGAASGEDTADRVWTLRRGIAEEAGTGKAGNLRLPGVHPRLWAESQERSFRGETEDCGQADAGKAERYQAETAPATARVQPDPGGMAEVGGARLLPVPRDTGQLEGVGLLPAGGTASVAAATAPSQST